MGKILFIRGGAVGDFILTLPAIKLVRDSLPDNEIEILGYPSIAELATVTGLADRVRSIEDSKLATFFVPGAKLDPEWCDYFSSFDIVVSYLYDPDEYFSENLKAAGVKTLLPGVFRPQETEPFVSAARQLAKPLETLALFLEDPELELDYASQDSFERSAQPVIALHPGSGSPLKNWSYESWIEVLRETGNRHPDAHFLITSGEAENNSISQFYELLEPLHLSWEAITDKGLAEIGAIYREVDFYLGHDSGISHLAASAGCRGILLFGPSNPAIWAPETSRMKIVASSTGSLASIKPEHVLAEMDLFTP